MFMTSGLDQEQMLNSQLLTMFLPHHTGSRHHVPPPAVSPLSPRLRHPYKHRFSPLTQPSFFHSTKSSTTDDDESCDSNSNDPFKAFPSFRHLYTIKSKSQLLQSYTVTPPIQPWPRTLSHKRLISLFSR